MELTPEQKAGLAAGEVLAAAVAASTGPVGVAAVQVASTILNGVLGAAAAGKTYGIADFARALEQDDAARADGLAAEEEAGP